MRARARPERTPRETRRAARGVDARGRTYPLSRSRGCSAGSAPKRGYGVEGMAETLDSGELRLIDAWWRAANYLSVGQIYLLDNPLLREPLRIEHVKPRLLGHWGTTPGLNFIYAHMNRVIRARDLDAIYIAGPGHGGPGVVANVYLEGTYTE